MEFYNTNYFNENEGFNIQIIKKKNHFKKLVQISHKIQHFYFEGKCDFSF